MYVAGQVVGGKYRLDRLVGQGAFATVWAATNTNLERKVALKILADAPARKASTVERFLKEARICATPIHPVIVGVQDLGQTEAGTPYLVMELLEGHTLDRLLRRKGALPWGMVVELSRFVIEGLAAAHERGIIHRDVKPSNLFLVRDRCLGPPVRILDLGLARDLSDDKRLTRTGQVVGTANFLPPETLLDEAPKGGSKAGDVFAVGMVMFAALTGRFPFSAGSAKSNPTAEVLARARFYKTREPLPGPRDYDSSIPSALDRVVREALAVDPTARYADCGAMRDALAAAVVDLVARESGEGLRASLAATRFEPRWPEVGECGEDAAAGASPSAWHTLLDFASADPQPALASTRPILFVDDSETTVPDAARRALSVGDSEVTVPEAPRPGNVARSGAPSTPGGVGPTRSTAPSAPSRPSAGSAAPARRSRLRAKVGLVLVGAALGAVASLAVLGAVAGWLALDRAPAAPAGGAGASTAGDVVEMELRGVPPGAAVRLDGVNVGAGVLRGVAGRTATLEVVPVDGAPTTRLVRFVEGGVVDLAPAHGG
jgi:serine/threonine-protein kinase